MVTVVGVERDEALAAVLAVHRERRVRGADVAAVQASFQPQPGGRDEADQRLQAALLDSGAVIVPAAWTRAEISCGE